ELGVALVDIGGGTMSLGLFTGGGLCYTQVLPYGGNHVTNDIAVGLRTSLGDAERLKLRHGCAGPAMATQGEMTEVGPGGLRGLGDLFAGRLGMAARVGMPEIPGSVADTVSSPAYATGVGLVIHAARQRRMGHAARSLNGNGTVYVGCASGCGSSPWERDR